MKRQVWGTVLVLLGIMALLQGTGQFKFGLTFWPVVGVLFGASVFWSSLRKLSWFGIVLGLWVGSMGLAAILENAGVVLPMNLDAGLIARSGWPLLLIAIGLSVIAGKARFSWTWDFDSKRKSGYVGELRYGQEPWTLDQDLYLEHGVGDVKVDLSTATVLAGEHMVTVKAGVGEVLVRVPDNVSVVVEAKGGIGELTVLGEHRNGLGLRLSKTLIVPESPVTLHIKAELGIGSLRIVHTPARPNMLVLQ